MNDYKFLEKMLGSKFCPDCGKTLKLNNFTACCTCGCVVILEYKDKTRNKDKKSKKDYQSLSNKFA